MKGTPDTLRVVLGVETRAPSAKDALAANNDKANALIDTLKQKGVAAKDIENAIRFQLDSLHPYGEEEVAWGWSWLAAGAVRNVPVSLRFPPRPSKR